MTGALSTTFLLATVSTRQLQNIGQCIWNWKLCGSCYGNSKCIEATCGWSRAKRLFSFWNRYKDLTESYVPEFATSHPALSSHEDLLRIIEAIRNRPDLKREELCQQLFPTGDQDVANPIIVLDRNRAINIAASVLFLTNCGTSYDCAFLEDGCAPISWQDSEPATAFVAKAYPKTINLCFEETSSDYKAEEITRTMAVTRLVRAGLVLEPTTDLQSHLMLDYRKRKTVVRIFHCPAALKEMLLASQTDKDASIIPRELALETLDTIYEVLFPSDMDSQKLLLSLVRKHRFDQDLLQYDMARYRRDDDPKVTYSYFGSRLAAIYNEVKDPTPRPGWESWFQKYSSPRYMLMATMIGVFIAVVIGFLGLVVTGFQTWLTYQQWKHPVKQP